MEDQTNPVFPVDGESGETDPLMADALDGATTDEGDEDETTDDDVTAPMDDGSTGTTGDDDTLSTGLDGGSGDPGDDRAFLMDQAPADLSGAPSDGADTADSDIIAGATGGNDAEVAGGSGPDEDDAEAWGVEGAGSEREEADRADAAEALGLGVEDEDDPLDDGATR